MIEKGKEVGFPLLIKAVAGGGGKGIRIAYQDTELRTAIEAAKSEGLNSFANGDVILERYFENARHIEFQIFGDTQGNVIHLLERECSIQRRYQKILEESPSPALTEELRQAMGEAAVLAAKAINYQNAGTVEFILADNGAFFFLEMNTRLQVEHPVNEMITGLDLVEWQILVAEGQALPLLQDQISSNGYALEFRVYAEDASNNFFPSTGKVLQWQLPDIAGLRVESGIETGSMVDVWFDPMLAKIIMHGKNRAEVFRKMNYVLNNTQCIGLITNIPFLENLTTIDTIQKGDYSTAFIANHFDFEAFEGAQNRDNEIACIAAMLQQWHAREEKRHLIRTLASGWRNNFYQMQTTTFEIKEQSYKVNYRYLNNNQFQITVNDTSFEVILIAIQHNKIHFSLDNRNYITYNYINQDKIYVYNHSFGQKLIHPVPKFPIINQTKNTGG